MDHRARRVLACAAVLAAACAMQPSAARAGFELETERQPLAAEQEAALRELLLAQAARAMAKLEDARSETDRFYALPDAAVGAFYLERYRLAADLAAESLEAAESFRSNWNYGNAIHRGHTVLGLLALREGDRRLAVEELHKAGATPGSPQLGSFGPSMQLALALLRAGESDAVLVYLEQCRAFWAMGGTWLGIWESKIRAGEVPNFFMRRW